MKIFISHSSKDREIIKSFIDNILLSGCKIDSKSIVCTSFEWSGVKQGEDIRTYLKENLRDADYVIFMISKSYLQSTICLNEMGAAWILDCKIKPFVFPNMNLPKDLTWLYEGIQGSYLTNSNALDEIYDELRQNSISTSQWNQYKQEFIDYITKRCPNIPNIDLLCPINDSITGNLKNILNPHLTEFLTETQYALFCEENDYDLKILIENFNQNDISWCYRVDSVQNWHIDKKSNDCQSFYFEHGSKGMIGDFRFRGHGQVRISYYKKGDNTSFFTKIIECK